MILSFAVRNFRSFAGEARLDLTSPKLRTAVPRAGQTWIDCTERIAGIYGPNASGKSTVLEAIRALSEAVRFLGRPLYAPSLCAQTNEQPTEYAVEFVAEGIRYLYEVTAEPWGVSKEALYSYPKSSKRTVFVRHQANKNAELVVDKGTTLTGPTAEVRRITKPRMLFLANAHRFGHAGLIAPARALIAGIGIEHISFRERLDEAVLHRVVMEMVSSGAVQIDLVKALVKAADLGLDRIEIRQEEVPDEVRARIMHVMAALNEGEDFDPEEVPRLNDAVVFVHTGANGTEFELPMHRQSSGTITWLTTAWHALNALRQGSLLLVDELDASMHPELTRQIVKLFLNTDINKRGAQLIFSTHDVSLLGNAPTKLLEPRNVWFTEKDAHGVSELFSLAEFDNRPGNNTERRYMAGQFGAVPDIADALLLEYVSTGQGIIDG